MDIYLYKDLISKLTIFLFAISKDFNLLMRLEEFLMCAELIFPRRRVEVLWGTLESLICVSWVDSNIWVWLDHILSVLPKISLQQNLTF